MIDRQKVVKAFNNYLNDFDKTNEMVIRKIKHTYRVADLSEELAKSLGLNEEEQDLAYVIGILHDIGRFKQVTLTRTYKDSKEVDHAIIGKEILFKNNKIKDFVDDEKYYDIIEKSVEYHSLLKLPEGLTKDEELYCKLIRDADKLDNIGISINDDILKINIINGYKDEYKLSEEFLNEFWNGRQVPKEHLSTIYEFYLNMISFVFDLNYKKSFEIIRDNNYLNMSLDKIIKKEEDELRNNYNEGLENIINVLYRVKDFINDYINKRIESFD